MRYFDGHADTLTELGDGETLQTNRHDVDLDRVGAFCDTWTQVFALWRDRGTYLPERTDAVYERTRDRALALLEAASEKVSLVRSAAEMHAAHEAGKAAAFLSVEDVSFMGSHVGELYEVGARFAMLAWNYDNEYACGAAADQSRGLTSRGRELVRRLTSQGVVMDCSHLSDAGVRDLLRLVDGPVIASHSNAREVRDVPRNMERWEAQEIIDRRGLIGLNLFGPFVADKPTMADLLRHAEYFLDLGGADVLCMGGDLDGCDGLFPAGVEGVQSMPALRAFFARELGEDLAEKIFYANAERFIDENL